MQPPFRSKQEVIINVPLGEVWSFCMDLTKIPEFHPRVVKVDLLSGKALREPGASYQCHLSGGKHISVSYDKSLLRTRQMMLENKGHAVISSATIQESIQHCREGNFDLFIIGHSIPSVDKRRLVDSFRHHCRAPIIALRSHAGEEIVAGADYQVPDAIFQPPSQGLGN